MTTFAPTRCLSSRLPLLALLAALALTVNSQAQRILAQWNFNDTNSIAAAIGSGEFTVLGSVTPQYFTGSPGDPAVENYGLGLSGFPAQGTEPRTAGVQFAASTVGYNQIVLSFDFRGSSTANRKLWIEYSTDGVAFSSAGSFLITTAGSFQTGLTLLDLASVPAAADNPNFAIRILSDFVDGANYGAIQDGSAYGPSGTWRFDLVTIAGAPIAGEPLAPRILVQPQSLTNLVGTTARFAVVADGTPPLTYQWTHATTNLPGAVQATLSLPNLDASQAGDYRVIVGNAVTQITSAIAQLTVQDKPGQVVTNIAYLRSLIDADYVPIDTTTLYTVEGVVTTHTNLTSATGALFNLQDDTAGISVFVNGGAGKVPPVGAKVRVTGPLAHFNGLLEFSLSSSNPAHSWTQLSTDNPLPKPIPLNFSWQNEPPVIDAYEGSYLVASNVWVDATVRTFTANATVTMTNEWGELFALFVNRYTDVGGQVKPTGPVTVYGVLGQYDTTNPRSTGYQLIPTRFADIVSATKAPTVRFTNVLEHLVRPGDLPTNTFTDLVLHPGEKLSLSFEASDPEGRDIAIQPLTAGLPASAQWSVPSQTGKVLAGGLTFQPVSGDAGQLYPVTLLAWNTVATNTAIWNVYVPSATEQLVSLTEYLANPTATADAPFYNPLRRDPPTDNPSQHDEYLELVNLSGEDLDLLGWTIADAVGVRHRFYDSFTLGSSNAVVVYGGPLGGLTPNLEVPSTPASESSAGLALNNAGDTLLVRNADGHLVIRIVYSDQMVSSNGSITRFPDLNGAFIPQTQVASDAVTPGRQYDGKLWSEPPTLPPTEIEGLAISLGAGATITLTWQAEPGRKYSVLSAVALPGPFTPLATGLSAGQYTENLTPGVATRFYRISTP